MEDIKLNKQKQWTYCDECYYFWDICPGDIRCRETDTQTIDNGCFNGRPLTDEELEEI